MRGSQPARAIIVQADDRCHALWENGGQRLRIAKRVMGGIDREELPHRVFGHRVGIQVAHGAKNRRSAGRRYHFSILLLNDRNPRDLKLECPHRVVQFEC